MSILEIAPDSYLSGAIALRPPFAPVKSIYSPGSQVIAGPGLSIGWVISRAAGRTVRHARVGTWPNVGEAQRCIGKIALGAGSAVLCGIGGRHELRRGATGRCGCVGVIGGRQGRVICGLGARARVGMGVRHDEGRL